MFMTHTDDTLPKFDKIYSFQEFRKKKEGLELTLKYTFP